MVFSLHAPARRRFKRNSYIVPHPMHTAQADLVDMQMFASKNDGFRYLLTVIDVFSKKAFAIPIKVKSGVALAKAFDQLFKVYVPAKLQTDRGKEFINQNVDKIMKDFNVTLYFSQNSDIKCSVVERFNRTLKSKMFKYFSSRGTRRYIEILPSLLESYNNSYHRTIRMAPNDVSSENVDRVFWNTHGSQSEREMILNLDENIGIKFRVGDTVRIKYTLTPMDKSYYPNWQDPIFKIKTVIRGMDRIMYHLTDENGANLGRRFYQEELQKVDPDTAFRVTIIKRDTKKKQVLVKWLNHPNTQPSWIPEKDLL